MLLYKLLKKPFFGKFMVPWRNPLALAEQKEWERISVKSKSGSNIQCLIAKPHNSIAKATIVMGHPMGKEAKGYFLKNGYTDLLRSNHYNVVVFDINGFGESVCGNFAYHDDIVAVSKKAKEVFNAVPIGYHGISLGGQMAVIAFIDNDHQFDFAIIESAATTLDEYWINFPAAYKALKLLNFVLPKYRVKIRMVERIRDAKKLKSILFIYSEKDELTPVQMGERFLKNSKIPATLWTVKNAGHA
jgi:pimeloyl-ACP methyl ester carboxylesterase